MVTLEQVERLREKTNVSYNEAKEALEKTKGDILEAIINLEKEKRISEPEGGGFYSSQGPYRAPGQKNFGCRQEQGSREETWQDGSATFAELAGRFFRWCGRLIDKGNRNSLEVKKDGCKVISLPVTVLALLLLFMFWIVVPLIILGLFFGYRYRFTGPDLGREAVNRAFDSAAKAAEDLKKEVKGGHEKPNNEDPDH